MRPGLVWLIACAAALLGALAPAPWWQLGIAAAAVVACGAGGRANSPALRFGLAAAAVFVALRVVYRVLFGSTIAPPAEAIVLLELPAIQLGGPLTGIVLFGVLTLDQLLATLVDASRFAVVFIVFGAANALADARTLLARAPQLLLPIATVLSLALGSVPALLASVQRVDRAARMRGERPGPALLVPVFEQSVERATVLGASMEMRGYGGRAALHRARTVLGEPLVEAHGLTVRQGGRVILEGVDLELRAGQLTVLTGPTGSGKSSLLAALAGMSPTYTGAELAGEIVYAGLESTGSATRGSGTYSRTGLDHGSRSDSDAGATRVIHARDQVRRGPHHGTPMRPAQLAGEVGYVPQRAEHSFVAETVRAELAFAPARRGDAARVETHVEEALRRFDLAHLADRDPATLSAGEATRTALAAAVLARPRLLLLDEPLDDLDPGSVEIVLEVLRELLAAGCAVLIAEHRPKLLRPLCTALLEHGDAATRPGRPLAGRTVQWLALREGRLESQPAGRLTETATPAVEGAGAPQASMDSNLEGAIELARDLVVERAGRQLLRIAELRIVPDEVTVLRGANGSGKTSLLEDLALSPGSRRRAPGIALVPHRVDDLLIRDTIAGEFRHADRRAGARSGTTALRFAGLIAAPSTPPPPHTHPRDASAGTRLALGIAVQLTADPRVLLLDEPTRGLDREARTRLAGHLAGLAAAGTAVLLATHDTEFAPLLRAAGSRVRELRVEDGSLA